MKLAPLQVLSDGEIRQIHETSLDILSTCGICVKSNAMLERLKERGFDVDIEEQNVRFSRASIEEAVASAPDRIALFDREGAAAFVIGDGTPRVAAGHNAVFWVDSETGQTRPSTINDVEEFARLCEQLPDIDMVGVPVMPQDVPDPRSTLLYGVRACIENSKKPVFFSTDSAAVNSAVIEMLRAVCPREDCAYGISQLSPTSPLWWEEGVLDALADTVAAGVPLAILPEPNAGVSAPFTLAGLLTVNNAECLSGLVIAQTLKPGHPTLYANSWTTTDMRTGAALVGSVETSICRIAGAQLAKFYGLPCHTTAPNSDNHAHDEQNSWEKTLSQFAAIAAGNDLIVNCGMFATGMTCSHEQLLMDAEITGMARRLAAGVEVNDETIASGLIRQIGPGGTGYLTADHTVQLLRSGEHFLPKLTVRGPRASWEAAGSPDTYELARRQVREMLSSAPPAPLDEKRTERMTGIISEFGR